MTKPTRRVPFTRAAQAELGTLTRYAIRHQQARTITKNGSANESTHDNQDRARKITHSSPRAAINDQQLLPADAATLARTLASAWKKRGKRRTLRLPTPPRAMGDASMYERTRKHLRRLARRLLHDLVLAHRSMPTVDELAAALEQYVWERLDQHVRVQEPGSPRASGRERHAVLDGPEAVERVTRDAATYALRDPDEPRRYVAENRRRASAGGARSKRRHAWETNPSLLDELAALGGSTAQEQADHFRCSLRTITEMRKALRGA